MITYPLSTMTREQAISYQFRLVDIICQHFEGQDFLNMGSVGVVTSVHTQKVEQCLADFFYNEDCILVRGAGTGAIRWGLFSMVSGGETILVHDAPIYPTTETTLQMMNLNIIKVDFNDYPKVQETLKKNHIDGIHIQLTRQQSKDSYDMKQLTTAIRSVSPNIPISVDDNYGAMKVPRISSELGADISSFSLFKLLGPEGIACVVGKKKYIDKIRKVQYSGGSKVQGHEAMDALRSLVYAPVSLALQSEVIDALPSILNNTDYPFIKKAIIANSQSKVLLVEFTFPIAQEILSHAPKFGALPHPVGAESRYDLLPLFYKVSGTFLQEQPNLINTMIRINPNRAGIDTILRILKESYALIKNS